LTTYLLVRHGTTDWVDTQLLHGITDIPLNERGREQASSAAGALKNSGALKMYSSSLSRCAETAQIIGKSAGLEPILTDSLVEINFGWLEGKKIRDHDFSEYSKLVELIDHHYFTLVRALSGESKSRFERRVLRGWLEIMNENPSGTVIIVAHSGVLNTILMHFFGKQFLNGSAYHHLNPCSITEISVETGGSAKMVRLNDRSHIPENLQ
jgi:broad specificity phosphatase PhoE